ncbi:MAG TPA: hypothetical protein VJX92_25690 [Methylomirabilota bacterium]|nr:hypothetical protein [Methylomirabilota bacterium]
MARIVELRGWLLGGTILCAIGLERLVNAGLVGPLGSDFTVRLAIGVACMVIGIAAIVAWLCER